jgi:hypothetical protein
MARGRLVEGVCRKGDRTGAEIEGKNGEGQSARENYGSHDDDEAKRRDEWNCRRLPTLGVGDNIRCEPDVACARAAPLVKRQLVYHQITLGRPPGTSRERVDVQEDSLTTKARRDESETLAVSPLGDSSLVPQTPCSQCATSYRLPRSVQFARLMQLAWPRERIS